MSLGGRQGATAPSVERGTPALRDRGRSDLVVYSAERRRRAAPCQGMRVSAADFQTLGSRV